MSIEVLHGDCVEQMRAMPDACVDSIVTDPPYLISFMRRKWDASDGIAGSPEVWREALRVLKPGGHMLAFGAPRTYHRMACAIEDAGFEIRDQIGWLYGTGFPKSLDVSKAIDKTKRRDYVQAAVDIGVQLPARSLDDWIKEGHAPGDRWWCEFKAALPPETWQAIERRVIGVASSGASAWFVAGNGPITAPATPAAQQWAGWGTALKPAWEPICVARKPLSEKTVAANVLEHGTGALNIDATRVGGVDGRWPANCIHDGSDEVLAAFAAFGERKNGGQNATSRQEINNNVYGGGRKIGAPTNFAGDSGTAARFFYSAKASRADRAGSKHPTVKPISLMRYLCKLVTPPGGTVLDPFAGSGTTLAAARMEGFHAIGIEQESEYIADIRRRIAALTAATQPAPQGGLFDAQEAAE